MKKKLLGLVLLTVAAVAVLGSVAYAATIYTKSTNAHVRIVSATSGTVSYSATIQPLLNTFCVSCHSSGDVNLTSYATTVRLVTPGNALDSALYKIIGGGGNTATMPPSGSLTAAQVKSIGDWINQGAGNN